MRRHALLWLAVTAWWLAYGLVQANQLVGMGNALDPYLDVQEALWLAFASALPWIPLTVGLFLVVERWPVERGRLVRALLAQSAAVAAVIVLRALYVVGVDPVLHLWYAAPPPFLEVLAASVRNNVMLSWLIVGVAHAWAFARRGQQSALQVAALEASLTRARLEALSAQLNPHFLFNALNAVAELIHIDPEAADRMLVDLSALLRRSLASPGSAEVPVAEELELLERYLAIEKARLGERLHVDLAVEPTCRRALLPPLLLQPLAENGIVHGIARRRAPGTLRVRIAARGARLAIEIRADGAGVTAPTSRGHGIGLGNTRDRLRCLYGDDWRLDLALAPGGESVVSVELPLRLAPESVPVQAVRANGVETA